MRKEYNKPEIVITSYTVEDTTNVGYQRSGNISTGVGNSGSYTKTWSQLQ